jgi:hypothetical protein
MRAVILVLAALLVASCATSPPKEYPQTHHLDLDQHLAMINGEQPASLPAPFDQPAEAGECTVVLMVSHARGALPLEFDISIVGEAASYDIWKAARIEEGISMFFGEPSKELAVRASRVCLVRVPSGDHSIVVKIHEEDAVETRESTALESGGVQLWAIMFSPMGTMVKQLDPKQLQALGE